MADGDLNLATALLLVVALLLAIAVLAQILSAFTSAYVVAPAEITTFIDAVDFSIQENESYDADITKVPLLADKMRLGKLLREIQRCGDDLREELNRLLIDEGGTKLRTSARLLWAAKRGRLEEKLRRLDLLRMRFLVVYMGLVASKKSPEQQPQRDPEKMERQIPSRPSLPLALAESITKKHPPLRRLTTQAMGHNDSVGNGYKHGWAGVVQELQSSPRMHKRHASIEMSMATAPARLGESKSNRF